MPELKPCPFCGDQVYQMPLDMEKEPIYGAIATLAYRCIQWENGEMKGYDMQMFESLLPIMIAGAKQEECGNLLCPLRKIISNETK